MPRPTANPVSLATLLLIASVSSPSAVWAQSEATAPEDTCPELAPGSSIQADQSPDVTTSGELKLSDDTDDTDEGCAAPDPMSEEPVAFEVIPVAFEVIVEAGDLWFDAKELVIPADGETTITLENSGFVVHNLAVDDLDLLVVAPRGHSETITIVDPAPGTYEFYCSISGHRQAGMVGMLTVQ